MPFQFTQSFYTVAQERREPGNLLAERRQPSSPDFVGCAFGDDEGTLPIVFPIKQHQNFAPIHMAKGLYRIGGATAPTSP